jgi:hypothetical protein
VDLVVEEERAEEERGPNSTSVEELRCTDVVEEERGVGVEERGTGVEAHAEEGMRCRADTEEGVWWSVWRNDRVKVWGLGCT